MAWSIETTDEFVGWLRELPPQAQQKVVEGVSWLEIEGPNCGRPRVDTIKDSSLPNLKELRVPAGRHVLRIFFLFDPRRCGIILCGGDKAGVDERRFYKRMIAFAEQLYREYVAGREVPEGQGADRE